MRARTIEDVENIIDSIDRVGRISDGLIGFRNSYFRVGIDPFINFIPGLGPLYTMGAGGYMTLQALRAHVPLPTIAGMGVCVAVDVVIGTIPGLGYVTDFVWRGQGMAANLAKQAIAETHFIEGNVNDARAAGYIPARSEAYGESLLAERQSAKRRVFLKGTQ